MRKFNAFVLDFRVLAGKLGWLTCRLGVLLSCPRQGRVVHTVSAPAIHGLLAAAPSPPPAHSQLKGLCHQ